MSEEAIQSEQIAEAREYSGIGRGAYFVIMVVLAVLDGLLRPISEKEEGMALAVVGLSLIVGMVAVGLRLQNMGSNPLWSLLLFVPIANVVLGFRCLAFPEGYHDTRRLDTAGRVVSWIVGALVVLVMFGLLIAFLNGS